MAVIYLKHPRHGTKVACSDLEAQADRKLGWVDFDPNEKTEPPSRTEGEGDKPVSPVSTANDLPDFLGGGSDLSAEPVNELAVAAAVRRNPGRPRKTH